MNKLIISLLAIFVMFTSLMAMGGVPMPLGQPLIPLCTKTGLCKLVPATTHSNIMKLCKKEGFCPLNSPTSKPIKLCNTEGFCTLINSKSVLGKEFKKLCPTAKSRRAGTCRLMIE